MLASAASPPPTRRPTAAPEPPRFSFDARARRYRAANGRFLSEATVRELRDRYADAQIERAKRLAERYARGAITLRGWERLMRRLVKDTWVAEYALGRGGVKQLEPADLRRLNGLIRQQFGYLRAFREAIARGQLSPAQIAARSALYPAAATNAFEQGRQGGWQGLALPAMPADGKTPCGPRCRCSWSIRQVGGRIEAHWQLGGANPCSGCRARAERYRPFVVSVAAGSRAAAAG